MSGWSREFTIDFIKLYEKHPCLWKTDSREYRDRIKKSNAYQELVAKVQTIQQDATRETVVKKINNLRCPFRQEFLKVFRSKSKGLKYQPKLWYFNYLQFLIGQSIELRKPQSGIYLPNVHNATDICAGDDFSPHKIVQEPNKYLAQHCQPSVSETVCESQTSNVESMSFTNDSDTKRQNDDHAELSGRFISCKLRLLSCEQQIYAEKLIFEILFEAELGNLSKKCRILFE